MEGKLHRHMEEDMSLPEKKMPQVEDKVGESEGVSSMTAEYAQLVVDMLEELEHPSKSLSKWEIEFVESLTDQWFRKQSLSAAQFEKLETLYREKGT